MFCSLVSPYHISFISLPSTTQCVRVCVCAAVVADRHVFCRWLFYLKSEHKHMNHLCVQNAAHNCSFAEWYCVPPSSSRFWCLHGIYGIHKIIITLTLHRIEAIKLLSIVHAIHKFISLYALSLHTYFTNTHVWHSVCARCAYLGASNKSTATASSVLLLPHPIQIANCCCCCCWRYYYLLLLLRGGGGGGGGTRSGCKSLTECDKYA